MTQCYTVLRTGERTDRYTEDIQAELKDIATEFVVLAGDRDVFPETDLQAACAFAQEKQLDVQLCLW